MNINELKCVVGKAEADKPAFIRLFGSIDEYNCTSFNEEFRWLEQFIRPSKIVVLINSEGGSCLHGMSVFSTIQLSEIETECVNEGLAASMASIIWIAGTRSYMRDYSILMIHNPFLEDGDNDAVVKAFKQQLSTIYCKRFGLSTEKVKEIMDGPKGQDGTYFSAQQAVDAGILPSDNVLKTSKQTRNKVKSQIETSKDKKNIREVMEKMYAEVDENKLSDLLTSIHNQTEILNKNEITTKMNEQNAELNAIAAQLGFKEATASAAVSAKIAELLGVQVKLTEVEGKLNDAKAKIVELEIAKTGSETRAANLQIELDETKASLNVYKEAEEAKLDADIEALVNEAVKANKIEESAKNQWVEMAHANLEMVKLTLASIAGREKISEKIAEDPENVKAAKEGSKTEEAKLAERVQAVVGTQFEFKKL